MLSAVDNVDATVVVVVGHSTQIGGLAVFHAASLGLGNGNDWDAVRYLARRSSFAVGDEGDRRPRGNDVDPSMAVEGLTRGCGGDRFVGGYRLGRDEVPW